MWLFLIMRRETLDTRRETLDMRQETLDFFGVWKVAKLQGFKVFIFFNEF